MRLKTMVPVPVLLVLFVKEIAAFDISDEEYAKFPRLYHLDDYDSCLSQPEGLYCVGTFSVQPKRKNDRTYELMKEYSKAPYNFNRTLLHRGYCVSARCPRINEKNTTLRFEKCVAEWGKSRSLQLPLQDLQYCRTYAQEYARKYDSWPLDVPQKVFLAVIGVLMALNLIGTVHDVVLSGNSKRNKYLEAWSLCSNWRKLTALNEDGDPRLQALLPIQGLRVLLLTAVIFTHTGCVHDMTYIANPRYIEKISKHPALMLFLNGTSVTQVFVVLSSFLLAYNILLLTNNHQLKLLPFVILKRLSRLAPVYLLIIGYAATWWPRLFDGPLWPMLVESESAICRQKFWYHALFINNLVSPHDNCLVQTWFLAVDMQLYILAAALTLFLVNRQSKALKILAHLFVASCLLNAILAYAFEWRSLVFFINPENLRTMYRGIDSFAHLYISPWGSLPACLVGIFTAFLHYQMQEQDRKFHNDERLVLLFNLVGPIMLSWIMAGRWVKEISSPLYLAAHTALDRPVLSVFCGFFLFCMVNQVGSHVRELFAWRGWHAMGRMSLSVLMVHWCIIMAIVAAKPTSIATSFFYVAVDMVATTFFSYSAAIPLTLMVEYPIQRTINALTGL